MSAPPAWDDNGWWIGAVAPLPVADSFSLLAPDPESRLDAARFEAHARRFFRIELALLTTKRYPGDGWPRADRAELMLSGAEHPPARVELLTVPLDQAPEVRSAARAAGAITGAGFDALVARAVRLWQIPARPAGDAAQAHPAAAALVLASVLLAPILAPGGGALYGVKTGRARLAELGWKT